MLLIILLLYALDKVGEFIYFGGLAGVGNLVLTGVDAQGQEDAQFKKSV